MLFHFCRYRLRSKVEIENVAEDFSCWQRFGGKLSENSSTAEEPEAAAVGWGTGVDRAGMSASHGNDVGWQWFKDPRLDCLGFRGIFKSSGIRELSTPTYFKSLKVLYYPYLLIELPFPFSFFSRLSVQHLSLRLTKKPMR